MNISERLESLRKIDIADLDMQNIGSWPAAVKVFCGVIVAVLVLALGYVVYIQDLTGQLDQQRASEVTLKEQFATKAHLAANLEAYALGDEI